MKKAIILSIITVLFFALTYAVIKDREREKHLEETIIKLNARVKYLHNQEGYTWEAARKIGAVELGLIPKDAEYNMLMED